MNTKHISLAFVVASALLAGCARSPIEEVKPSEQLTDLELSYVGATETKVAVDGTTFPQEGEIGLFLFKDEMAETPYGESGYSNAKYSYNSTIEKWTASPSIKVGSETGYLYGYYPYKSASTDVKAILVASSLNGDDVMYATKQTVTDATAAQTAITMNHALARVSIKVINNGYTGEAKLTKIKLSEAEIAPTGTLNATNGSITATKSAVTLDVPSANQTLTTAGTTYECLLVPSSEISSRQTIALTLTIDGQEMTATLSGDNAVIFAQGTKSNITINLSNSGISVQTVSVEDWNVVEIGGHKVTVNTANDSICVNLSVDDAGSTLKIRAALPSRPCFLKYTVSPSDKCTCTAVTDSTTKELTLTISSLTGDIDLGIALPDRHVISVAAEDGTMGDAYINTPGTASGSYYEGESLSLHAVPADGSHIFHKWSDGSTDNPRAFKVGTTDSTLTAEFFNADIISINGITVAVKVEEGAEEDIFLNDITALLKTNTAVITAYSATAGRMLELHVDKESACGAVSAARDADTYTFTIPSITEDLIVTVKYVRCNLTLLCEPADSMGTFKIDDEPGDLSEDIIGGTKVEIEAAANTNHRFVKWTDNDGTENTRTVTVTSDSTITAEFIRQWKVKAQVAAGSEGMGTFKIDNAEVAEKMIDDGATVKIQAVASSGFEFMRWTDSSGATLSTDNPYTVSNVTSEMTFKAVFGYKITAKARPAWAGTVTGAGAYSKGDDITLTATPAGGNSTFVGWAKADSPEVIISSENPYSFTISEPASYIAKFETPLPDGALSGLFTVDASGKQVIFSKGNLWCGGTGSSDAPTIVSWNFESKQYESCPTAEGDRDISHISHFLWCRSAEESVKQTYTETNWTYSDILFTDKADFAVDGFNAWRTLKTEEWRYLFSYNGSPDTPNYDNDTRRGKNKTGVTVCGKANCVVLLPDDWQWGQNGVGTGWQTGGYPETSTDGKVTWNTMEAAGAVCLPAAGCREGDGSDDNHTVEKVGSEGFYWSGSITTTSSERIFIAYSSSSALVAPELAYHRDNAFSIRLVAEY